MTSDFFFALKNNIKKSYFSMTSDFFALKNNIKNKKEIL